PMKLSKDLVDIYKYFIELYSLATFKDLNKFIFHFRYNKIIKDKYININFVENYLCVGVYKYYIYNTLNLDTFLNLSNIENVYYDLFIFNKGFVNIYIISNSFFLYSHHNVYLTSNVLKLSKLLNLAENINKKEKYYSNM